MAVMSFSVNLAKLLQRWSCRTNLHTYIISDSRAHTESGKGGTSTSTGSGESPERQREGVIQQTNTSIQGYPHIFTNFEGKVKFPKSCNGKTLLEYPIYADSDKKSWQRDVSKAKQAAPPPMRVVSTTDHNAFCGVMTHVTEDSQGRGTGEFALCTLLT